MPEHVEYCKCIYQAHCHPGKAGLCKLREGGSINMGGGVCSPPDRMSEAEVRAALESDPSWLRRERDSWKILAHRSREHADRTVAERARWIRAFNRLEKAVTNHITERCLDGDDLAHVHKAVMRDLGPEGRDA